MVAGTTLSFGAGERDAWVIELEADGEPAWQTSYGANREDWALGVQPASDEGYLVTGYTRTTDTHVPILIMKLGAGGDIAWQLGWGDDDPQVTQHAHAITEIAAGYLIAGAQEDDGVGDLDAWHLAVDGDGTALWARELTHSNTNALDAIPAADGGGLLVGYEIHGDPTQYDQWATAIDEQGEQHWQWTYGGERNEMAWAGAVASNGAILLAGEVDGDVWLQRLEPTGELEGAAFVEAADHEWSDADYPFETTSLTAAPTTAALTACSSTATDTAATRVVLFP